VVQTVYFVYMIYSFKCMLVLYLMEHFFIYSGATGYIYISKQNPLPFPSKSHKEDANIVQVSN